MKDGWQLFLYGILSTALAPTIGSVSYRSLTLSGPLFLESKVPEKQRKEWSALFRSYITRRSSLRVLFHLIDGRHGPVGQDHTIMELMAEMPETAR